MTELAPLKTDLPDLKPGQTVRVHQRYIEGGKERIQIFEGIVLSRSGGRGVTGTFTVRKISNGVGVERIFPLHSPLVAKVDIISSAKVRRANLGYLRKANSRPLK